MTSDYRHAMVEFLKQSHAEKTQYDITQIYKIGAHISGLARFDEEADMSSFMCSSFVTVALKEAGLVDYEMNPALMSPPDVVNLPCYDCNNSVMLKHYRLPFFTLRQKRV